MKNRFIDEQFVGLLRLAGLGIKTFGQFTCSHGFTANTFYVYKRKLGAMSELDVKRPPEPKKQNAMLKCLPTEREVEIHVTKAILEKAPDVDERRKLGPAFERRNLPVESS